MHLPIARWITLTLLAVTPTASAAAAEPATRPTGHANPDYAKWSRLRPGAWVRVRVLGDLRTAEWTTRLTEVTAREVVLTVSEVRSGQDAPTTWQDRVPAVLKDAPAADAGEPAGPAESGDEVVPVADRSIPCHWETRRSRKAGGTADSGETVWAHPDVPAFVKKVSWLAADPVLNLHESHTTESLAAYDLPLRDDLNPAAPATSPTTRPDGRAGDFARHAAPPTKFSWTYHFDPPGWRRWARLAEGRWEERWESGEAPTFTVVGWIDDGTRRGTVVIRDSDHGLETVIPDAGKGAELWFHELPNGKWVTLGALQESSSEDEPTGVKAGEREGRARDKVKDGN